MRLQVAQSLARSELFSWVDNSTASIRVEGKDSSIQATGRHIAEYSNIRIDMRENHKFHFIHAIRLSNNHLSSSLFLALSRSFASGSSVTFCCPYNTLAFRSWLLLSLSFLQEIHQSMVWCSLKRILSPINPPHSPTHHFSPWPSFVSLWKSCWNILHLHRISRCLEVSGKPNLFNIRTVGLNSIYIYIYIHTGCPRRNGQNFGRVFLMLNYTNITQDTYIQSWTVTEIMAREVWNFDSCYTLIDYQICIKTG